VVVVVVMKKNIGNIYVSTQSYDAIFDIFYQSKFKNISNAIDSIILNYLAIGKAHEKTIQEMQKLKQDITELKEQNDSYRKKLIGV